jgi:hypothetical protein
MKNWAAIQVEDAVQYLKHAMSALPRLPEY